MNLIQAVILAFIEGVTEFLPISSTGHLILASEIFNIRQTDFVKSFEIFIQLGAITAVVFLYGKILFESKKNIINLFVAFLPSAFVGLVFYDFIKNYMLGNSIVTVITLFTGGLIFILFEVLFKHYQHNTANFGQMNKLTALKIGVFQAISVIPGVSRSGATIVGGMLNGLGKKNSAEFSFLLAIPTIFAATGFDLVKSNFYFNKNEVFLLAVGFIFSFLSAILGIKLLIRATTRFSLSYFGIYRIVLAIVFYIYFLR